MKSTQTYSSDDPGVHFPQEFLNEMAELLQAEYSEFIFSLSLPPLTGLRVNSLKLDPQDFQKITPFPLVPVPWCSSGFTIDTAVEAIPTQPGKHPYHTAGLYYLQEPSAMLTAELLAPTAGEKVLDLAAAPGGKTTHLAALMGNKGLLVANEIHPKRVWDLAENLERLGVTNAVVLNESPENLANYFGEYFDRVLLDAPCSGEGMFRKSETARKEWRPGFPLSCSIRQAAILEQASRMVKPGGHLVYSTCTFSPVENEGVIARFLDRHKEFEIMQPGDFPGSDSSIPGWISLPPEHVIKKALRIWPHHAQGEGHFAALLIKTRSTNSALQNSRAAGNISRRKTRRQRGQSFQYTVLNDFAQENLNFTFDEKQIRINGNYFYRIPEGSPPLEGLRSIHTGWWLGTLQKDRFLPSHSLAMGLRADQARNILRLSLDDQEISAYLAGENCSSAGENGWILITINGFPIGWGKRVNQVIKNYYPKGLRRFS